MKVRKKPVEVEAIQWTGKNRSEIRTFLSDGRPGGILLLNEDYTLTIPTLEGDMKAIAGDWIIKGVRGEFYPCKPDIFEATYEVVE